MRLAGVFTGDVTGHAFSTEPALRMEARSQLRAGGVGSGVNELDLAARNSDVAEALEIMGQAEPPDFAALYRVYEIIEHAGALTAAMRAADVTRTSVTRFSHTANHPDASGAHSRHARSKQSPPKHPMTIEDARIIINRLLAAWVLSLERPS